LEEQIAIVEEAKSHAKDRRNRRPLFAWWRQTRDFRSLPRRFRSGENRAKRGKARVSCTRNRETRA